MKPPLSNGVPSSRRVKVTVDLGNTGMSIDNVVLDPPNHIED
jgi:hypothetical protein